jgi:hypothetical protein
MPGLIELALVTILALVCVRWVARRLGMPTPAAYGFSVVFVLVALTLWAEHVKHQ